MSKFKFKPDKKDTGSPCTNKQRADRAHLRVFNYDCCGLPSKANYGSPPDIDYDMTIDLLSDIAHLADEQGWNFNAMLDTVKKHWRAER